MGKRTSDFVALAAILGGAGLGLGLTSLVTRIAHVARVDDVSVQVHVVPGRVLVRDGSGSPAIYFRSRARWNRPDWAPSEELRAQVEELRLEAWEMADFETLSEALEGVEALEDLDLENLTIDIRRDEEDRRRRRGRRRPRR